MRQRHQTSDIDHARPEPDGPEEERAVSALRAQAAELAAVADDFLSRALSGNSAEYLSQNRQAGGQ